MESNNKKKMLVSGIILIIIIVAAFYFLVSKSKSAGQKFSGGELVNPAQGLSYEEIVKNFNEEFVFYLLANAKAYNLKEKPFSDDKPKIEMNLGDESYYAIVDDGDIFVSKGQIEEEDIIIFTSKEEVAKMLQDENYVSESFNNGNSKVELVAGELELASKGYLKLYEELTGKSYV